MTPHFYLKYAHFKTTRQILIFDVEPLIEFNDTLLGIKIYLTEEKV